jgi:citrate lyase subunit beta/citryl-CoA lyase
MNANYIMISGHNQKHIDKIPSINGVVMLNLEDGVPKNQKQKALENIVQFLKYNQSNKKIIVRINSLKESGLNEIVALNGFNISFRIPKINNFAQLDRVLDLTNKDIYLSIETKQAFFDILQFKHPQIKGFYLGILDLFDELGFSHSLIHPNNQLIHKILIDFSLYCAYLEKDCVGFVYQHYKDLDGFRKWCKIQKEYGFDGVGCITPNQLTIANEIFKKENLEYAKTIVNRFEKEGPFTVDGLYVDEPIYKNYKNILRS